MKTVVIGVSLVALLAGGLYLASGGKDGDAPSARRDFTPAPRLPLPEFDHPYHGMAWQIHHTHDVVERARKVIREIADLGADTILISNAGYQEHAGSETFRINPKVTPTREQWMEIFAIAHENGLRVGLMPIVLLSDPRGTEWRGVIKPPNWDDWFDQYTAFICTFARLAREGRVEFMMVGSELISTERFTDRWRKLIREVREVYPPPGKLTYSGNWDHYRVVEFWDDLDMVGMTSYYKLSAETNPTEEELLRAWAPIKAGILRWQRKIGKPLLFTEVGWCSQEGASIEPWNYYYNQYGGTGKKPLPPEAMEEQRRCYRAFMETWEDTPEVAGIIWWEWNESDGGITDYNYTPKGKPAEAELRHWYAERRRERATASKPAAPESGS